MFQTEITKTRWLVHKYYLPLIDVKNLYKKKIPCSLDSEKCVMMFTQLMYYHGQFCFVKTPLNIPLKLDSQTNFLFTL